MRESDTPTFRKRITGGDISTIIDPAEVEHRDYVRIEQALYGRFEGMYFNFGGQIPGPWGLELGPEELPFFRTIEAGKTLILLNKTFTELDYYLANFIPTFNDNEAPSVEPREIGFGDLYQRIKR